MSGADLSEWQQAAASASSSDEDEEEEEEEEERGEEANPPALLLDGTTSLTAPGWGEEPPSRSHWWKARQAERQKSMVLSTDSVAADFAARREVHRGASNTWHCRHT